MFFSLEIKHSVRSGGRWSHAQPQSQQVCQSQCQPSSSNGSTIHTHFCSSRVKKKLHFSPIFKHVSAYAYTNETMKRSLISISLTGFKWSSLSCQNVEWDANSCSEFEFNFWCYLYFDLAHWQPLLWRWILHDEDRKRKTIKNGWIAVMLRHIQALYGWLQSLNPGCRHVLHRGWSYFSHPLIANFPQQRSYYHTQVS